MSKRIISRVILIENGEVHIALNNYKTVFCTPACLFELFIDPYEFMESGYLNHEESSRYINMSRTELTEISGMTLAVVYEDATIEIIHSSLLQVVRDTTKKLSTEPINLKNFLYKHNFSTQKQYFIKMFLDFANQPQTELSISRKVPLSVERQEQIMREILNTRVSNMPTIKKDSSILTREVFDETNNSSVTLLDNPNSSPTKVTVMEYAEKYGVAKSTVMAWIRKNKLQTAEKREDGLWYIDIKEPYPKDLRAGRKVKEKADGTKNIRLKGSSYKDVQIYIKERKLVTEALAPYIRTYEEVKYYERNHYHEVEWNGRKALIIDINPYYYCERLRKTNRELIMEGNAPVVPDNDRYVYQIHHIGQKSESPFAIIPEQTHNGKETYKIFHTGSSSEELHTPEFEIEKRIFWKTYLAEYDKYGSFKSIPFKNSKHTKQRR